MITKQSLNSEATVRLIKNKINNINTFFVAKIIKYYPESGTADIQPLEKFMDHNFEFKDHTLISSCPVMMIKSEDFYLRIPYKSGDVVYCGCSKHALDNMLLTGNPEENQFSYIKKFDINDAVVLGGLMIRDEEQLSSEDRGSFLITNRKNGAKISFNPDGSITIDKTNGIVVKDNNSISLEGPNINIKGSVKVDGDIKHVGDMESSGNHTVKDTLASGISVVNHIHKYTHDKPLDRITEPPTKSAI